MSFDLESVNLSVGSHASREDGVCAMEAVAWMAGEVHTDHPKCVCPSIGAFVRSWNDAMNDADRNRLLKPLLPKLIGTAQPTLTARRSVMAIDWIIREYLPAWLDLAKRSDLATYFRSLEEIRDSGQLEAIQPVLDLTRRQTAAAGDAARDAAWAAALAAARAAALAAARDAALAAARDAARNMALAAAGDAARAAALAAAWAALAAAWAAALDAARDAAWDAAWDALSPTVVALQLSAVRLLKRMCALEFAQ